MKPEEYYSRSAEDVVIELGTSKNGLSHAEAARRQQQYGPNALPKKKKDSIFKLFIKEFGDPMTLLLLVAIGASVFVGEYLDAGVIAAIILVDAIMGTYQENKANNTAAALASMVATHARVIRDGKEEQIEIEDLTIGDYVLLESGDKISADIRLVETHNFTVDESILTGESVQAVKSTETITKKNPSLGDQSNIAFSGTTVVSGRAQGVVVKVGLQTELGKIADSLNETVVEKSPLTIRVERFSKQITALVLIVAAVITVILIAKQVPYTEIFLTVIAFSLSAMPEGLPLALTMALTIASNRMAKKNVIVRKLNAAESLGSCTVIASDKTGTLTVNQQTAKIIALPNGQRYEVSGTGYELKGKVTGAALKYAEEVGLLGVLNNEASIDDNQLLGDSIDIAFLVLGKKLGVKKDGIKILETIPYESENKYSAVFYEKNGEVYCTAKGSLEVIEDFSKEINFSHGNSKDFANLNQQNDDLARDGYRVIALANGKVPRKDHYSTKDIKDLTFMGMVGFIDPIRKEVVASIRDCRAAGIKVLMVTGDHPLTAFKIGRDLKLVDDYAQVATSSEVEEAFAKGEDDFDKFVAEHIIYARVTPLQKLNIVNSLKRQGEFVAVTGDGVNDAPALKAANIGVAMGSGTDIARETADMIIVDDNFKSIVAGIQEGRVAYSNIRKIIFFLISCGIAEAIFFCAAIAMDMPLPFVAVQLLWLNVVTDGIQDFAMSFEKAEKGILTEKPRNPKESIFDRSLVREIIVSALVIAGVVFAAWWFFLNVFGMGATEEGIRMARTYAMWLMVFIQNVHVFNCRSERRSAFSVPITRNKVMLFGIAGTIILQIIVMEVPFLSHVLQTESIPPLQILGLFGASLIILVVMEFYKQVAGAVRARRSKQ